jgi:hypothetical protein
LIRHPARSNHAAGTDGNRRFEAPLAPLDFELSSPLSGEARLSKHLKLDHQSRKVMY